MQQHILREFVYKEIYSYATTFSLYKCSNRRKENKKKRKNTSENHVGVCDDNIRAKETKEQQ